MTAARIQTTTGTESPTPPTPAPWSPDPVANHGCPDTDQDHDGIVDRLDKCPTEPEDKDGFQDDDGCPDPDNDHDGVLDTADACPNVAGPVENRGCPDKDTDKDGTVDRLDNCPKEAGPKKYHGCPKPQLVVLEKTRLRILQKVFFETASAKLQRRSYLLLDNVAEVLRAHPEIARIDVEGHTDSRGSASYNLMLSQHRAEAVARYLEHHGIAAARLSPVGYGETRPIAPNSTRVGRAANRRVEFHIEGGAPVQVKEAVPAKPVPKPAAPPAKPTPPRR